MNSSYSFFSRYKIGAALSLCGVPLGMYANFLSPINIGWSPVFMLISVVLLTNWNNLIHLRFPSYNRIIFIVALFQLIMLIYGGFSSTMTFDYASNQLYIIALSFAYFTIKRNTSFDYFPIVLGVVSLPALLCGLYYTNKGMIVGDYAYILRNQSSNYFLEPFTVAYGAIVCAFGCLCGKYKNIITRIISIVIVIIAFYVVLMTTKRTPIFIFIVGLAIYLNKKQLLTWTVNKKMIVFLSVFSVSIFLLYSYNSIIQTAIDSFWNNFVYGVMNLMGDKSVWDQSGSAMERTNAKSWADNYIIFNFDWTNYIFGKGYMVKWLDIPIYEAFLDMGLIGFCFYMYIIIVVPVSQVFKPISDDNVLFGLMLSTYALMSCISSGTSYQYIKYSPICFLAYSMLKQNIKFK